jgi:tRNA-dihydrouridine synthase
MCLVSVHGNNATPPSPALAPGAEAIDARAFARELGQELALRGLDKRLSGLVPGFDAPFVQAGLAGYSDAAMRIIARRHGCPLAVTEALLDRMLLGGGHGFDKADLALLAEATPHSAEDQPLVGQIIGADPDEMAAAALKMIEQATRGDKAYRLLAYGDAPGPTSTDPRWRGHTKPSNQKPSSDGEGPGVTGGEAEGPEACEEDCTPEALLKLADVQPPESYDPRTVFGAGGAVGAGASVGVGVGTRSGLSGPGGDGLPGGLRYATIDVNLACPVKKIDRKSRGGHWLREPQGAIDILRAVRAAAPKGVPCTVKLRRAYDDTPEMARNFEVIFSACYELGYAWTTVHARTVEQKYIGPSRWAFLRDLCARHPDKAVIGSGDIWDAHDVFRMIRYTGVSAVSVARGCIGNPWLFRQARQMLAGQEPLAPTLAQQRRVLHEHFALSVALNGERTAGRMMRKFGIKFAQHHPRREEAQLAFINVASVADWQAALDEWYPVDGERDGPACGASPAAGDGDGGGEGVGGKGRRGLSHA